MRERTPSTVTGQARLREEAFGDVKDVLRLGRRGRPIAGERNGLSPFESRRRRDGTQGPDRVAAAGTDLAIRGTRSIGIPARTSLLLGTSIRVPIRTSIAGGEPRPLERRRRQEDGKHYDRQYAEESGPCHRFQASTGTLSSSTRRP
jgi:hypothetical protein